MENKKFDFEFKEKGLEFGLDMNQDGEKLIKGKLYLTEAIQELIQRGGELEGAKVVGFKFDGSKMVLKVDTDRDGEPVLELELDLAEGFDEATSLKK